MATEFKRKCGTYVCFRFAGGFSRGIQLRVVAPVHVDDELHGDNGEVTSVRELRESCSVQLMRGGRVIESAPVPSALERAARMFNHTAIMSLAVILMVGMKHDQMSNPPWAIFVVWAIFAVFVLGLASIERDWQRAQAAPTGAY